MKLFGFERFFLVGVAISLVCMGLVHVTSQALTRTTGQFVLLAMIVAAGFTLLGVLTPISRWNTKKVPFGILGMTAFTALTFGYALTGLVSLSTGNAVWFATFCNDHFNYLTTLSVIGLGVYVLFEREPLRKAVFG